MHVYRSNSHWFLFLAQNTILNDKFIYFFVRVSCCTTIVYRFSQQFFRLIANSFFFFFFFASYANNLMCEQTWFAMSKVKWKLSFSQVQLQMKWVCRKSTVSTQVDYGNRFQLFFNLTRSSSWTWFLQSLCTAINEIRSPKLFDVISHRPQRALNTRNAQKNKIW